MLRGLKGGGVNEEKNEFLDEVGRNVDIQFFLFSRDPWKSFLGSMVRNVIYPRWMSLRPK